MPTAEEIMMVFNAKDNASNVMDNLSNNTKSMSASIQNSIASLNSGMMNLNSVTTDMLTGLTGKSASDLIFGTSSKAETNKVLLKNMTSTQEAADSLYKTVDKVTDSSLTSMQELIPAMNAFKAATGASDQEMQNITDDMANFGAAVLAQTGSTELAQSAMMDLSKGAKGAFASLDQYGVSEDALKRTGLWSGKEDDVEGYMAAVTKVIGSTEDLMKTNEGLDAQIGKSFSRAGKKIGNEFLPQIKDLKQAFLDLDSATGGGLAAGLIVVSEGFEVMSSSLYNVSNCITGFRELSTVFQSVVSKGGEAVNTLKNLSKTSDVVVDSLDIATAAAHSNGFDLLPDNLDDIVKEKESVEKLVEEGAEMGALAPEAAAAGAGMEATSVSLGSIASGAMAMLAPLLEISIVIAVMIPVVAGLAAEALLFIKGIQILIDSLSFDKINLSGAIEGIKQVGVAVFEIGVAMGAMSFASLTTATSVVISGITGILNPIKTAGVMLKNAAKELQSFKTVKIDSSIPNNLKNITTSLKAVSESLSALNNVTLSAGFSNLVAWVSRFSSTTDAIKQVKKEITEAANEISKMKDLPSIDTGVVNKLKSISSSLTSVSDAISALRSLRDGQNWDSFVGGILGGADITTTLNSVKSDIIKAANALNGFTGLPTIDSSIGSKLKNIATTLTSVSDAMTSLRKLRDDGNWDSFVGGIFGGNDIVGTINTIKNDLWKVSTALAGLNGMPAIPEGLGAKIQRVTWTLNNVSTTVTSLRSVPPLVGFNTANITLAVTSIRNAATQLNTLSGVQLNGGVGGLLSSINNAITGLRGTLSNLAGGFQAPAYSIGSNIVTGVRSGLAPLNSTVISSVNKSVSSAIGVSRSGGSRLGTSMNSGFKSSLNLHTVMSTEMGYVKSAVDNGISAAKDAAQSGAADIVQAFQNGINVGSPGDIAKTMKQEMKYTKEAIVNSYSTLKNAGFNAAKTVVDSFNPNLNLNHNQGSLTTEHLNSLQTTLSSAPSKANNRPVTIIIREGAVQLDARNLTTKESKQVMINALEGLDLISDITVEGV